MAGIFELQTTDPDEFRERIVPVADPDRVRAVRKRFFGRAQAIRLPRLAILRADLCGGDVLFEGSRDYGFTASLGEPLTVRDCVGTDWLTPEVAQASANAEYLQFDISGKHVVLACQLDAGWVENEAARGRCDLGMRRRIPTRSGSGSAFLRTLIGTFRELAREPSFLAVEPAVQERENRLLDLYLRATSEPESALDSPTLETVRRAEKFMLAHLDAPVPVTRVAEAARVPLRTLHRAFRKHYGIGPMRWLRERRLDAVQRELLAAAPGEQTVTEVALRYGFDHLGRFGQQYRRSFGETPSQTLGT